MKTIQNNSKLLTKTQRLLNKETLDKIFNLINSNDEKYFLGHKITLVTKVHLFCNAVTLVSFDDDESIIHNSDWIYLEQLSRKLFNRYARRV